MPSAGLVMTTKSLLLSEQFFVLLSLISENIPGPILLIVYGEREWKDTWNENKVNIMRY